MKAIILARVSTEEQRDAGNSLPAQIERLQDYCKRKGLEIIEKFSFDESAYKTRRDEFDNILKSVEQSKEKIAVCFDKVDRFSRNVFDKRVATLYDLAMADKIELHFASDNLVITSNISAVEKFHFGINLGLAKYYSDAISDNTRRALEQKRRNGEWTGKAPIGYKNIEDERGNKDIVFDEEKAHLVRRIFELYATGNYSIKKVREQITKEGLLSREERPLAPSMVEYILKNPFYHGVARSKREIYQHKYLPLITKALFDQCQQILRGWGKKPFQYAAKPYVFRGLLRCARCGCAMSPEMAKGKYVYYACSNGKQTCEKTYVPERDLLKPIYKILRSLDRLPQEKIDEVVSGLKKSHEAKQAYHGNALTGLRTEYDVLQKRLDKMYLDHLDGRITQDAYDKYLQQFKARQQEINILLEEHTDADESYYVAASTVLNLAKRALEIFESSEVAEKRALLNFLLQNSVVNRKKPMFALRSPFDTILTFANQPTGLRDLDSNQGDDFQRVASYH
ncbi:MAG: hypothetical protein A2787_01430 [Omnitrophica WOR_2 bacterium RIFCSPHIGHO2_01_FULL_48_9]|nr:MAG: hypothetical protein A2787_01430 [Omnitrophica WOR_2 bacterium RIFCSPHIGHO2_01_FULL_48_9]